MEERSMGGEEGRRGGEDRTTTRVARGEMSHGGN